MTDIYVLECEGGNVYVGKTTRGLKRLKQHINGRGAEWTKLHKPKRVIEYYTNATDADERKVTNQMIKKYGAKRVRGAGLTKRKLTKKEIDNLNKKVGFTSSRTVKKKTTSKKKPTKYTCGRCGRQGHNRTQCYAKSTAKGKSISGNNKKSTKSRNRNWKTRVKTSPNRTTRKRTNKSSRSVQTRRYRR